MMGGRSWDHTLRTFSRAAVFMIERFEELLKAWVDADHSALLRFPELAYSVGQIVAGDTLIEENAEEYLQRVKTLDHIRHRRVQGRQSSFLYLAISTQNAQCSDPRDILYSLWNIPQEKTTSTFRLAYDIGVAECYLNFTKALVSQSNSLDVICLSRSPAKANNVSIEKSVGWNHDIDLPSWYPDYRQNDLVSSLIRRTFLHQGSHENGVGLEADIASYHANIYKRGTRPLTSIRFQDRSLIVQGVILDSVKFISEAPTSNALAQDIKASRLRWISDIINKMAESSARYDNTTPTTCIDEANHETADNDKDDDTQIAKRRQRHNALLVAYLSMLAGEPPGAITAEWHTADPAADGSWAYSWDDKSEFFSYFQTFQVRSAQVMKGRRLVITENGYMGLAPWHVREGFMLAVLCGCSVPVLLEYVGEEATREMMDRGEDGHGSLDDDDDKVSGKTSRKGAGAAFTDLVPGWYFRGDCYVQGWMEGEMMREYGTTTEEAWERLSALEYELKIN